MLRTLLFAAFVAYTGTIKIALASCWNQQGANAKIPWEKISHHNPDVLIFAGDTIYSEIDFDRNLKSKIYYRECKSPTLTKKGDSYYQCLTSDDFLPTILENMNKSFQMLIGTPYSEIQKEAVVIPFYDDHDFGRNNWDTT